jgi:hypothetical protein
MDSLKQLDQAEYLRKYIIKDLIKNILKYANEYVLLDWIEQLLNENKIELGELSRNPNAIDFLMRNPNEINWDRLSQNPNAISLLKQNINKINWFDVPYNPNKKQLLEYNNTNLVIADLSFDLSLATRIGHYQKYSQNMDYFKQWSNEIKWCELLQNPNIFKLKY